jgi:hypothetical protein
MTRGRKNTIFLITDIISQWLISGMRVVYRRKSMINDYYERPEGQFFKSSL